VSLDAATAATYAKIRGIDAFDTVIENVRLFARLVHDAQRPRLSFWLTAMRENLDELPALVDLAAEIGVSEVYVQRLVLIESGLARADQALYGRIGARQESALDVAAQRAALHGVRFRASGLASPRESLRPENVVGMLPGITERAPWSACYRMWTTTYITVNGNVLPCCISAFSTTDYDGLVLGNVFQIPFDQIWNGVNYTRRRKALHTMQPLHPCELCGVDWSL
jgi:MoaA/NifB/PqqE/SkfB family radical SAM enzyme